VTAIREARPKRPVRRLGDRIFAGGARGAGILILVLLAGVAAFLIWKAAPALTASAADLPGGKSLTAYIWPLLFGTLLAAVIALLVGTPLAVAIALFITFYAPRRVAQFLGYVVDLLAAIPSVVFGFWGIGWLAPRLVPFYAWLTDHLGFLPPGWCWPS
jgi:phosphate transport system permease protein